jgi:acetamidase/formamidase
MNVPGGKHCHQDCPWVSTGAMMHIKAQVDGLGLCVADVHGYQSSGTLAFSSIDVAAAVQLRVERSQGWLLNWPLIETQDEIMVLISHSSILEHRPHPQGPDVAHEAYQALREVVAARTGCSPEEANTIVAAAMDLRNCAVRGVEQGLDSAPGEASPWDLVVVAALPKDSLQAKRVA